MDRPRQTPPIPLASRRRWRKPLAGVIIALLLGAATTVGVAWWMASRCDVALGTSVQMTLSQPGAMTWVVGEDRAGGRRARIIWATAGGGWCGIETAPQDRWRRGPFEAAIDGDDEQLRGVFAALLERMPSDGDASTREAFLATPIGRRITAGWAHAPRTAVDSGGTFVSSVACGWPALSCWGWQSHTFPAPARRVAPVPLGTFGLLEAPPPRLFGIDLRDPVGLPFLPVWPGFLINTLFYALAWYALLLAPGAVRRARRRKRGQCVACGYDLAGLTADRNEQVCPECGSRPALSASRRSAVPSPG